MEIEEKFWRSFPVCQGCAPTIASDDLMAKLSSEIADGQ